MLSCDRPGYHVARVHQQLASALAAVDVVAFVAHLELARLHLRATGTGDGTAHWIIVLDAVRAWTASTGIM